MLIFIKINYTIKMKFLSQKENARDSRTFIKQIAHFFFLSLKFANDTLMNLIIL